MPGRAYALVGDCTRSAGILEELQAASQQRYVLRSTLPSCMRGSAFDTAFLHFEEAFRQRVFRLIEFTLPMFDALRPDPRWQDLVRRIGLAP